MNKINFVRSIVTILVVVMLVGTIAGATSASAQSADGKIAVSPTEVSLEQGEAKTIAITYHRQSSATPQGVQYTLAYDPGVISVINQEQGSYLSGNSFVNDFSTPGEIEYAEIILDGSGVETNNGTIATITVEATSGINQGATTPLEFTTAKASEGSMGFVVTTTNGTVKAGFPNQTGDNTDSDSDDQEVTEKNTDSENITDGTEKSINTDEEINSGVKTENTTEMELNETTDNKTGDTTMSEQPANDSSTSDSEASEEETSGTIPGFGIIPAIISVLATSYIFQRRLY